MCGLFGMISKKEKKFNKRAFCTMGARNDSRGGDSCGIFIDGLVEYGVDKEKEFINFFRKSVLLEMTESCKIALGHCRKASVGKINIETAQPVVIYNDNYEVDYVLIHNGTIHNYKELANKYIPDINIDGLTDSQVMAQIFYHKGYDCLDEYYGGAVFVIHDYRKKQSLIFKGASKKYNNFKESVEERPLYYCWHNGRFVFSSIFETLYSFYYEETIYTLPANKLIQIKHEKLISIKEYPRTNVSQERPIEKYTPVISLWSSNNNVSYKIQYDGCFYTDDKHQLMHGIYRISTYGFVFPNKKTTDVWLQEVGFYMGRMLKDPRAFHLINEVYKESNNILTDEVKILINMLDFNPYSEDGINYSWFDEDVEHVPQGLWKWPMVDWSCEFNEAGQVSKVSKDFYGGWVTDYKMYTYDKLKIIEQWKSICAEE